jgi:hypothetical protein
LDFHVPTVALRYCFAIAEPVTTGSLILLGAASFGARNDLEVVTVVPILFFAVTKGVRYLPASGTTTL